MPGAERRGKPDASPIALPDARVRQDRALVIELVLHRACAHRIPLCSLRHRTGGLRETVGTFMIPLTLPGPVMTRLIESAR